MPDPVTQYQQEMSGCPHLGLIDDPATRSLYPSVQGCCFYVEPAETVALDHQQSFCLTAQHVACPVFQQKQPATMPSELRGPVLALNGNGRPVWVKWFAALALLLLLGGVIWLASGSATNEVVATQEPPLAAVAAATNTPTAVPPTATPTNTPPSTPTPTATSEPTPTMTPSPQATATATPTPSATPIQFPWLLTDESELALRQGPGLGYALLTTLAEAGLLLEVTGRSENGRWWQICCWQEETGWLLAEMIEAPETAVSVPIISSETAPPLPRAIVQAEPLNLRQGPTTDFDIVATATLDDVYEIVGRLADGSWLALCCEADQIVWSIREALFIVGNETAVPVITD